MNGRRENPQLRLAQELAQAPQQTQSLAASLAELIDVMETEEISFDRLPEAYLIDLAGPPRGYPQPV